MSTTQLPGPGAAPVDRSVRLMVLGGLQIGLGIVLGMMAVIASAMVLGGFAISALCGMSVKRASIAAGIWLVLINGVSFVIQLGM